MDGVSTKALYTMSAANGRDAADSVSSDESFDTGAEFGDHADELVTQHASRCRAVAQMEVTPAETRKFNFKQKLSGSGCRSSQASHRPDVIAVDDERIHLHSHEAVTTPGVARSWSPYNALKFGSPE